MGVSATLQRGRYSLPIPWAEHYRILIIFCYFSTATHLKDHPLLCTVIRSIVLISILLVQTGQAVSTPLLHLEVGKDMYLLLIVLL